MSRRQNPRLPTPTSALRSRTELGRNFPLAPCALGLLVLSLPLALLFCGIPFPSHKRSKSWRNVGSYRLSVKVGVAHGTRDPNVAWGRLSRNGFSPCVFNAPGKEYLLSLYFSLFLSLDVMCDVIISVIIIFVAVVNFRPLYF